MSGNNQNHGSQPVSQGQQGNGQNKAGQSQQNRGTQERPADPNRKNTATPTSSGKPETTAAPKGKSPVGGSDSLDDYDDSIMPDGQDARVDYDAGQQSARSKAPNRPNNDHGSQKRSSH